LVDIDTFFNGAEGLTPTFAMKLKEIYRTSTFAWSPTASLPLIATGSVAGALDESFSNESQLEIWQPDFMDKNEYDLGRDGLPAPKGAVTDSSRCAC
jgi:protein transport protein SEC31